MRRLGAACLCLGALEGCRDDGYAPGRTPARFTSGTLVIPRDRWCCLQTQMTASPDAGSVRILVDGETGLDQQGMNTRPKAGNHLLRTGVDWSSLQNEPFDLYID